MLLVKTVSGETSDICAFESIAGETFSVVRPAMSPEQEAEMMVLLREILDDEGIL